ncbi:MAG: hypothetical protein CVU90_02645 [Firmicutes bacterium HGW-Firmicutes-15]|nr:MAG: hypothetical protein CVU90_02645 [Firmicutes bacterium HGW-Firmicutes-15]
MENIELSDEGLIARETFNPKLSSEYEIKFRQLLAKVKSAYFENRADVIGSEILKYERVDEKDLNLIKYITACSILKDLLQQGWSISFNDEKIELFLKQDKMSDKDRIRYRMNAERCAQFNTNAAKEFINRLEKKKKYNGELLSIQNLIGDPNLLFERINNPKQGQRIVEPYIQLVSQARDEHTGYKINDIWKYFRYTWSIPYKSMPGRNIFYLVRDKAQKFHPVIGIFALGNSVLNLTVRDNDIGWTVTAIKNQMQRKTKVNNYKQIISETNGKDVKVSNTIFTESEDDYNNRIINDSSKIIGALIGNINNAIKDIYVMDLPYRKQTKIPRWETIRELRAISDALRDSLLDNKKTVNVKDWKAEARSGLFRKKRAQELANLLSAKIAIMEAKKPSCVDWLNELLKNDQGKTAIHTALIANRKNKIGSNMMEIIVCGAVPPYNDLLGGKLVSILACSPQVIADYTEKYNKQISEIASRMKGSKVVRDSHLVFLGTTSLYSVGSSQYNRIKIPNSKGEGTRLEFKRMGITEGYGTVYFSKETTHYMGKMLEIIQGGKKINNVFGEGTSPRFRMISKGLSALEIKADAFLRHHSPRIVYSIELASNTKEILLNLTDKAIYPFDINSDESINKETESLINYWYERWLTKRITTIDINKRLREFNPESILLSNTKGV